MNEVGPEIGLEDSTFTNASGWPNPNHRMSMHDLGVLATHLIVEFPEYYGYFAQEEFDYKDRSPANRLTMALPFSVMTGALFAATLTVRVTCVADAPPESVTS